MAKLHRDGSGGGKAYGTRLQSPSTQNFVLVTSVAFSGFSWSEEERVHTYYSDGLYRRFDPDSSGRIGGVLPPLHLPCPGLGMDAHLAPSTVHDI